MCGVFAISFFEKNKVKDPLIKGLKAIEYRGYDSFGFCGLDQDEFQVFRSLKSMDQEKEVGGENLESFVCIGHTRWATHGAVTIKNTHPFVGKTFSLVHNGTIENVQELRQKFLKEKTVGETDSEVVLETLESFFQKEPSSIVALEKTTQKLKGSWAFALLCKETPNSILFAREKAPLIIGLGEDALFLASDVLSFPQQVREVIYLKNGDYGFISGKNFVIFNNKREVIRPGVAFSQDPFVFDRAEYSSFFLKEIHQQPSVLKKIIENNWLSEKTSDLSPWFLRLKNLHFDAIHLVGCGSSYYAAKMGALWLRSFGKKQVFVSRAVLFDTNVLCEKTLYFFISQSGETADINFKIDGVPFKHSVCLVNTKNSSLERICDYAIPMLAGPEVSVASTKSFLAQIFNLLLLSFSLGEIDSQKRSPLLKLPDLLDLFLKNIDQKSFEPLGLAEEFCLISSYSLLPIASEGSLKIKELSYKASLAMTYDNISCSFNKRRAIILLASEADLGAARAVVEQGLREGAPVFVIAPEGSDMPPGVGLFETPLSSNVLFVFFATVYLQLAAFHIANKLANNIDKPRNLAKSVTVE